MVLINTCYSTFLRRFYRPSKEILRHALILRISSEIARLNSDTGFTFPQKVCILMYIISDFQFGASQWGFLQTIPIIHNNTHINHPGRNVFYHANDTTN